LEARTRDGVSKAITQMFFYNPQLEPYSVMITDTDGNLDPEVTIFGMVWNNINISTHHLQYSDRAYIGKPVSYGDTITPMGVMSIDMDSADGKTQMVMFGRHNSTDNLQAYIKNEFESTFVGMVYFDSVFTELWYEAMTYSGEDTELVVVGTKPSGAVIAKIHDAFTGAFVRQVFFPNSSTNTPLNFIKIGDINSNGTEDFAMYMEDVGTGSLQVFIRDGLTGAAITQIDYPND
jgi:hypothetical protein